MTDGTDAIVEELRTQTAWLRLLAMPTLRDEITKALSIDKRRLVYELSTGETGTREIAKSAGVGAATVSRYWTEWERVGFVRPAGSQGRVAHITSLASLGIPVSTDGTKRRSEDETESDG